MVVDRGKWEPFGERGVAKGLGGGSGGGMEKCLEVVDMTRSGQQKQRERWRHVREGRVSGNTLSVVEMH